MPSLGGPPPLASGLRLGLPLAVAIVVGDQVSKWWIVEQVMRPEGMLDTPFYTPRTIPVLPFLDIVMTWNRGVSFGMFNNDGRYNALILSVLSLVIVVVLLGWLRRSTDALLSVGLGLIIGGALGNVIDRMRFGAVADFVYLHAGRYDFPAFNLADSAISIGAVMLIADALFARPNSHKNRP